MDSSDKLGLHTHVATFVLIALAVIDVLAGGAGFLGMAAVAGGFAQETGEFHAVGDGIAGLFVVAGVVVLLLAVAKGSLAALCGIGLQRRWSRLAVGGLALLSSFSYGVAAPLGFLVAFDSREAFVAGMALGVISLGLAATVLVAAAIGMVGSGKRVLSEA